MSWVIAAPEYVAAAANDLAGIAATLSSANSAAAVPTASVLAAGADEVSAGIAAMFGAHAQAYQAISQQAALFHNQFVQLMTAGAGQYAETEAINALPMQPAQSVTSSDPSVTTPLSSTPGAAAAQASAPITSLFGSGTASAAPAAAAAGGTGLLPGTGITGSAVAAPAAAGPAHAAGGSRHGGAVLAAAFDTDVDADAAGSGLGGAGGMVFGPGAIGANALGGVAAPAPASGAAASGGQTGGNASHGEAVGSASHSAWMYGSPEVVGDVPAEAGPVASSGHGGLYQGSNGFYGNGGGSAEASGIPAVTPI